MARALREQGFAKRLIGCGYRDVSLKRGVELGVIDEFTLDLDEAFELLVTSGRDLLHAMRILVPEAWENDPDIDPKHDGDKSHHSVLDDNYFHRKNDTCQWRIERCRNATGSAAGD